jgi:AcrR family transcriptional regulator
MNSQSLTSKGGPRTPRSRYRSPLRDQQKADTRKRILEAVRRSIESTGAVEKLSMAAVAREAGVKERTLYRHFGTREGLIDAFFAYHSADLGVPRFARTEAEMLSLGARLFVGFEREGAIHRAFVSSSGGREMFVRLGPQFQLAFQEAVANAATGLPPAERRWLAAAANALTSGGAWRTLNDLWGMSGEEAGRVSRFALGLLFDGARARAKGGETQAPPAAETLAASASPKGTEKP